jgi:predicted TIM-barrel fold metal-dependent hydrolase
VKLGDDDLKASDSERRLFFRDVTFGRGFAFFFARAVFDDFFETIPCLQALEAIKGDSTVRRRSFGLAALGAVGFSLGASSLAQTREPIIDVHLHAYPADEAIPDVPNPANGKKPGVKTGEEHRQAVLAEMKRLNVVKGVVSGGSGDRLAAAIRWRDADPNRFIAGAGIRGSEDTPLPPLDVLRKAFQDGKLGVLGEVTAVYAGATLGDLRYEPYLALAEEMDIPVALHTGPGPPGISYDPCCPKFRIALANPILVEDVLNRHPKLRLSLMHAGWPFLQETIAILMEYPQVYVDVGAGDWLLPRAEFHAHLGALMRAGFGKRILFGSDQMYWPEGIGLAIQGIESAPFLSPAEKRDIFYNNAVRFLKLESAP